MSQIFASKFKDLILFKLPPRSLEKIINTTLTWGCISKTRILNNNYGHLNVDKQIVKVILIALMTSRSIKSLSIEDLDMSLKNFSFNWVTSFCFKICYGRWIPKIAIHIIW